MNVDLTWIEYHTQPQVILVYTLYYETLRKVKKYFWKNHATIETRCVVAIRMVNFAKVMFEQILYGFISNVAR